MVYQPKILRHTSSKIVVLFQIEKCLETHKDTKDVEENNSSMDNTGEKVAAEDATEEKWDKYFNCKNSEFYLYSIFSVTNIFEEVTVQFEIQSTVELAKISVLIQLFKSAILYHYRYQSWDIP